MFCGGLAPHGTRDRVLPGEAERLQSGTVPLINEGIAKSACRAAGERARDGGLVRMGMAQRLAERGVGAGFIAQQECGSHLHGSSSERESCNNATPVHDSS